VAEHVREMLARGGLGERNLDDDGVDAVAKMIDGKE
jgi:hypothetical protein